MSFFAWSGWYLLAGPKGPYGDLSDGIYTDHFSHMNSTRLFARVGADIWRKPLQASVVRLSPAERPALPPDLQRRNGQLYEVFAMPGGPAKPFVASWVFVPRFHPPGDLLLTAPVALLYEATDLSFSAANRLLILSFLLYAHIALYLVWRSGVSLRRIGVFGILGVAVLYLEVIHWTLEGFYEALVIAPLFFAARFLSQRRGLEAIAAFSIAATVHFRAYLFAPLALYGAWVVIRNRAWEQWRRREWLMAVGAGVLSIVSLTVFVTVLPYIHTVAQHNPVELGGLLTSPSAVVITLAVTAVSAAVFAWTRSWLDLATIGWLALSLLLLRQAWPWDILTILAWLTFPIAATTIKGRAPDALRWLPSGPTAGARVALIRDTRLLVLIVLAVTVFGNITVVAPSWLDHVIR